MTPQNISLDQDFIAQLIAIARTAGEAILDIYVAPEKTSLHLKADDSPVTAADIAAHHIIVKALAILLPLPIISEEASLSDFSLRKHWQQYWLVDPLDGTKEFIAHTDEFTVNIALVQNGLPVVGVVHVPVTDETYIGVASQISFTKTSIAAKYHHGEKITDLKTRDLNARFSAKENFAVLASARHRNAETILLLKNIANFWPAPLCQLNVGSSLKFCWIAEGRADFYPRLAPTCEWDTAAAQAVLVAAGGAVLNIENLLPLRCNQSESLLNPSFVAVGDPEFNWRLLLTNLSH